MPQFDEIITFAPTAGIDSDTDIHAVKPGDGRYRLNCRYDKGSIENIHGNALVTFALPNGESEEIGWCVDIDNNAIIFFLWNDSTPYDRHCIFRYFLSTNQVQRILWQQPALNFKKNRRITHANVVSGMLCWTDGYFNSFLHDTSNGLSDFNPPRKININQCVAFTEGDPNCVISEITMANLDLIKYPYCYSPTALYFNDLKYSKNNLRGKLFQFAIRYVYYDNEVSVLSPFSKIPLPLNSENADGSYDEDQTIENAIKIKFSHGGQLVRKVELFAREGNSGSFYYIDTIYKRLNRSQYTFSVTIYNYGENVIKGISDFFIDRMYVGLELSINYNGIYYYFHIIGIDYQPDNNTIYLSDVLLIGPCTASLHTYSTAIYIFHNDKAGYVLSENDQLKLFDNVPQIAGCQEFLSEGRIVFGDICEGFNNLEMDVKLKLFIRKIDNDPYIFVIEPPISVSWRIILPFHFYTGQIFEIYQNVPTVGELIASCTVEGTDTITSIRSQLMTVINALPTYSASADVSADNMFVVSKTGSYNPPETLSVGSSTNYNKKTQTYKNLSWQNFGLVYYDRGNRSGSVQKDENTKIFIRQTPINVPEHYEGSQTPPIIPFLHIDKKNIVVMKISHTPPEWATHYQVVRINNVPYFQCGYIKPAEITPDITHNIIKILINDTTCCFSEMIENFPKSIIPAYTFNKGDRIRFIGTYEGACFLNGYVDGVTVYTGLLDKEILDYDESTFEISIEYFDYTAYDMDTKDVVFEIYTPNKILDSKLYHEIGEVLPILNPHTADRAHSGNVKDQNSAANIPIGGIYDGNIYFTDNDSEYICSFFENFDHITISGNAHPANNTDHPIFLDPDWNRRFVVNIAGTPAGDGIGGEIVGSSLPSELINSAINVLDGGDVYIKKRFFTQDFGFICESRGFSDFYESDFNDIGRINAYLENARRVNLQILRFSNQLIQNTQVNGLSTFDALDYVQLDEERGRTYLLKQRGFTLKAIQQTKNNSIDVGRITTAEADGSSNVILRQTTLGTLRIPEENYGTVNPESFAEFEKSVYFIDIYNSMAIRDSVNGMIPISNYGAITEFEYLCKTFLSYGIENVSIIGIFDLKNKEYIVTFRKENTPTDAATFVFHELSNRWKTYYSFKPFLYANIGQALFSFVNGQLWRHEALYDIDGNPVYNNFYGTQYEQIAEIVTNKYSNKNRTLDAIALHTNRNKYNESDPDSCWSVDDITIEPSDEVPTGMKSRIPAGKFEPEEGILYSEILGDINTPGATSDIDGLINGREMRGDAATIRLKNKSDKKVVLSQVTIKETISEISY
uniref:Putative structural protein n=1 Tax=viral metagenome TaxID=1070528 RepID=A0A6M3KNX2_9ZZZZ